MFKQIDLDTLDAGWHFKFEDLRPEIAASPTLDDTSWERINLPHCAHIEPETCNAQNHWQGCCWYRLPVFAEKEWADKIVWLELDGAMQKTEIYLNGRYFFTHQGGYQRFIVPLTQKLEIGETNIIALRLDNRPTDDMPPGNPLESVDFCYYSGIYRSARLTIKEKLHITDPLEVNVEAGGGIFMRTLAIGAQSATLGCQVHILRQVLGEEIWNLPQKADKIYPVQLRIELFAPDGTAAITPLEYRTSIRPNCDQTYACEINVPAPKLWHPDHPSLYRVKVTLFDGEHEVESQTFRYGIRRVRITRENGIEINGEKLYIQGTNHHQDYPHLGNAAPAAMQRRDAMIMKRAGYNLIRLAHYTQHPALLDACDELGLCIMAPVPGWQHFSNNSTFINNVYRDCRELIRNERNRPSIILWEVSLNETYPPAWLPEEMHRIAHREYPGDQCFTCGDVYGLYEGWDVLFNRTKLDCKTKAVIVREYGDWAFGGGKSTSRRSRRDGEYELLRQAWNYQWSLNKMSTEPGYIGGCTWCMFDYNNGFRANQCECGDGSLFRVPKYKYYFFQSQNGKEPMVYIASRREEILNKVVIFSNCDEIELFLNGRLIKRRGPDNGKLTSYHTTGNPNWETVLRPWELDGMKIDTHDGGNCEYLPHPPYTFTNLPEEKGELKAVGYIGGKKAAEHVIHTPGTPVRLAITVRDEGVPLCRNDVVFVDVALVDRNGTPVTDNTTKVALAACGENAVIIGDTERCFEVGIASFVLKVNRPEGITLKAVSKNFPEATCRIG